MNKVKSCLLSVLLLCSFAASAWDQIIIDDFVSLGGIPGQLKGFGASFSNNDITLKKTTYKAFINARPITLGNGHCLKASKDLNSGIITQVCNVLVPNYLISQWCDIQGAMPVTGNEKEFFNRIYLPALTKLNQNWSAFSNLFLLSGVNGLQTKNRYGDFYPANIYPPSFPGIPAPINPQQEYFTYNHYSPTNSFSLNKATYADPADEPVLVTCQWGASHNSRIGGTGFNGW